MTDPVSATPPVHPAGPSAASGGPHSDSRKENASTAIVPAGPARTHAQELSPETRSAADSTFAAQVLGQAGRKRGLKGGAPVLDEAKAAYLETEWSGPSDRRLAVGKMTKTDV